MRTNKPYQKKTYTKSYKPKVSKPIKEYVNKAIEVRKEPRFYDAYSPQSTEVNFDVPILQELFFGGAQGDSIVMREGDRVEPTSVIGRYNINMPTSQSLVRIIIFQWKADASIDAPSAAKILSDPSNAYSVSSNYVADALTRKKFKVLHDKLHHNPSGTTNQVVLGKVAITKFNSKYINYVRGASTANQSKNGVYFLALSNVAVASTGPAITAYIRTHWVDDN